MNDINLRRLRWRCRRGLLELDLILGRFLNHPDLVASFYPLLDVLLTYPDPLLLDVVMGRVPVPDSELSDLVQTIYRLTTSGVPVWQKQN